MCIRRTAVALALLGASLATLLTAPASGVAQAAPGALTWSDEFNGPAGSAPDGSKWKFDIGGGGWGNNEQQYYTNSTRNAAHDGNGNMVITARRENPANYQCHYGTCQYTSARLLTADRFTQTYGRYEARIKIPRGQGIWPAFWMLGNDIGRTRGRTTARSTSWRTSAGSRAPSTAPCTVPATPAAARSAAATPCRAGRRSRTPSTPSPSTGHPTRSPGTSTASSTAARPRPTCAATAGSTTTRSS